MNNAMNMIAGNGNLSEVGIASAPVADMLPNFCSGKKSASTKADDEVMSYEPIAA